MRGIVNILFLLFSSTFVGQSNSDPNYQKHLKKITVSLEAKNYLKIYKASAKGLNEFKSDSYFNYIYAYSLFYSREHKKITKKFSEEEVWKDVFSHLNKSLPLKKIDKSFSKKIQRTLYSKINKYLKAGKFKESMAYLNYWFEFFDNSSEIKTNYNTEKIQDVLFSFGKELYLADNKVGANKVFDWMHSKLSNDRFISKYDGKAGYSAAGYVFDEYQNPKFFIANTAIDAAYLSKDEKHLIYLHNLVHMDPALFNKTYVTKFFTSNSKGSSAPAKSLVQDLKKAKVIQLLHPNKVLSEAAAYHANDLGKIGKIGHDSSDGTSFFERLKKYGESGYMAENCSYGNDTPVDAVLALLLDLNTPSLGHRKTILSSVYNEVGVATRPHSIYRNNSVFDFKK